MLFIVAQAQPRGDEASYAALLGGTGLLLIWLTISVVQLVRHRKYRRSSPPEPEADDQGGDPAPDGERETPS